MTTIEILLSLWSVFMTVMFFISKKDNSDYEHLSTCYERKGELFDEMSFLARDAQAKLKAVLEKQIIEKQAENARLKEQLMVMNAVKESYEKQI